MIQKIVEAAINGEITEFAELLNKELNTRIQAAIDERVAETIDAAYNVCEECDWDEDDDTWTDEDVDEAYFDENEDDIYDEEEGLEEESDHDARELHLYASNHADLHRQRMTPIHKNLRNKQAAGTYDSAKAHKAFGHAAKDAADRYHKEHGHRFSKATRDKVAAKMRDEFETASKAGEHDHLLHKKHKGHKVESVEHTDEAIKYGSAGDSTGTVTGKGKRDRGPGGEVMVQYKGSETYPKGAKLPIKARDIGRLIKQARKSGTTPYDSRNLRNPQLTRDHVEHEVDEAVKPAMRAGVDYKPSTPSDREKNIMKGEAEKAAKMRSTPDTSAAGRAAQRMIDARKATQAGLEMKRQKRESVEMEEGAEYRAQHFGGMKAVHNSPSFKRYQARLKAEREARWAKQAAGQPKTTDKAPEPKKKELPKDMRTEASLTPAQERDAERRLKPTRATVAKVRLRATGDEIADKVKKWQSEKGGNPGNTKNRRKRDLGLRDRLRDHVELEEAKKKKKAKKDHDGDGKIETPTAEWKGSRDNAIKAAIAARGGN